MSTSKQLLALNKALGSFQKGREIDDVDIAVSKAGAKGVTYTVKSIEYNINDENYGYSAELTQKIKKKCEIKKHQGPMKKNPPNKKSEPAAPRVISEPAAPRVISEPVAPQVIKIPSPKN